MKLRNMLAALPEGLADRCICALVLVVVALATAWLLATQMLVGRFA